MFVNSEQDLENYICENQDKFIQALKENFYANKDIKFLGRQVEIGQQNRVDLMYYYDCTNEYSKENIRNIIIVELKYRKLEPKDISQLSRYINTFRDCIVSEIIKNDNIDVISVDGVFVSLGQDELTQEISMYLNDQSEENLMYFMSINSEISFNYESYSHKEKYIQSLKLDRRINDLFDLNGGK